VSTNTKKN